MRFLCEKIPDAISHLLDYIEGGVFRPFSDFDAGALLVQESNRVNPFKRKIAFIGKSTWVMKSMRVMKFASESEPIPDLVGLISLLQKDQEPAFDSEMLVCVDDLLDANPQLCSPMGLLWRTVECPFQRDTVGPDETRNVRGRKGWLDIMMDG